jgi:D-alanyl-D-alanine carboxypeptidase/D-alanyl-D-alanine-endopeptidase (penicillin-binding protein 4)
VADAATGEMLEVFNALYPMPPASVAKAVTTAYGLDRLGPEFRFRTTLVSDGTIRDGVLDGDLWLVGGGDPVLDTDALDTMVRDLAESGIREVSGAFRIATDALPAIDEIDPEQLPYVGYNPSISALNLNFNRVFFEWERTGEEYSIRMDARSDNHSPMVTVSRMTIEPRDYPVYTFERTEAWDEWTVAQSALGQRGRALAAGSPPARLCRGGVPDARPRPGARAVRAGGVGKRPARAQTFWSSMKARRCEDILRGMMRWSTNLTAEVVGLSATQAGGVRPTTLAESGAEMAAWMRDRLGARQARFVDHSGLGVESRLRPNDMTRALVAAGPTASCAG